jgi:hypothetical protein
MRYANSLLLVWRLAELEAINLKSEQIQPPHFFLGLLKVVDIDLGKVLVKEGHVAEDGAVDEIERDVQLVRECFGEFGINATSARRMLRRILPRGISESDLEKGRLHRSSESREAFSRAEHVAKVFGGDVRALHMLFALLEVRSNNIDVILEESECPAVEVRSFVVRQLLKAKWGVAEAKERRGTGFLFFGLN